jgi:hypothetical protein
VVGTDRQRVGSRYCPVVDIATVRGLAALVSARHVFSLNLKLDV